MILIRKKQYAHLLMNGMCMTIRYRKRFRKNCGREPMKISERDGLIRKLKAVLMRQERMLVNII